MYCLLLLRDAEATGKNRSERVPARHWAISYTAMPANNPGVRRERPQPLMPPGPPWKIASPFGALHIIEDREALANFIAEESKVAEVESKVAELRSWAASCVPLPRDLLIVSVSMRTLRWSFI